MLLVMTKLFSLFQGLRGFLAQEIQQDDEELQPRQGLLQEQQVRSVLDQILILENQEEKMQ